MFLISNNSPRIFYYLQNITNVKLCGYWEGKRSCWLLVTKVLVTSLALMTKEATKAGRGKAAEAWHSNGMHLVHFFHMGKAWVASGFSGMGLILNQFRCIKYF